MHRHGPGASQVHDLNDSHEKSHIARAGRRPGEKAQPLSTVKVGTWSVIDSVISEGALRRRLLDMGLTPGTRVLVRKQAPLGDPIEIHLRDYDMSLRKADAEGLLVIPEGEAKR